MRRAGRVFFTALGFALGLVAALRGVEALQELAVPVWVAQWNLGFFALSALLGAALGFFFGPWLVQEGVNLIVWLESRLSRLPGHEILAGTLGTVIGLIIGLLVSPALARIPWVGGYLPTLTSLVFGYLGWVLAVKKGADIAALLPSPRALGAARGGQGEPGSLYKILDTSVIIDGRIADICHCGFLEGTLVIPSFVLDELRHIADSSDVLKRNRGRRGLDILNQIQKEQGMTVEIREVREGAGGEVDARLVQLAKELRGKVVTNDYNLNKVAELRGVPVLNVNELANALKPVVLPGEEMSVQVIKDGKETGQGVGYLDDGTMIVVEGGKRHIGERIGVEVTSVLQTAAGRMIFAKPKGSLAPSQGENVRSL